MRKLEVTKDSMRTLYESDTRPWVVAYSGGKDSTAVLQLVYELLLESCAVDADFPVELAQRLLETVKEKYARLEGWGAKAGLEKDLRELIEKDFNQALSADPAHDL